MKILFIGSVQFSYSAVQELSALNATIVGICTLKESSFNSDFYDLSDFAKDNGIPYKYVDDINSPENSEWIEKRSPDIIVCFGFSKLLKKRILNIAPMGVLGFHPAKLPQNRGRHPLIWALVLGLKETASTFFFMDEGADTGDILSQERIIISDEDDASSLYAKVTSTALKQIKNFYPMLLNKSYVRIKQDNKSANTWRKRGASDGLIDWRMSAQSIHNLVKALAKPYIGAHFTHEDNEIKVWKTKVIKTELCNIEPGKILDKDGDGCPVIMCGSDLIKLIQIDTAMNLSIGDYL